MNTPVLGLIGGSSVSWASPWGVLARVHLGRNRGMPMTQKAEPELVTLGPYGLVRHPIYSGLLVAVLGTALVTNLLGLLVVLVMAGYFYYCALVEERNLSAMFPTPVPPTGPRRRCSSLSSFEGGAPWALSGLPADLKSLIGSAPAVLLGRRATAS